MKTITIPSDYNPFEIEINGRIYVYKAGETVSVPDEVASAILNKELLEPEYSNIVKVETISFDKTEDAGYFLHVGEDGLEWSIPDISSMMVPLTAEEVDAIVRTIE